MAKLLVKIQNSVFPVRINGDRYQNGDELEIEGSQLNEAIMKVVETVERGAPNPDGGNKDPNGDDPFKELEGKTVDELKAYAEENNIDIGNASSEKGIIKKIKEANQAE